MIKAFISPLQTTETILPRASEQVSAWAGMKNLSPDSLTMFLDITFLPCHMPDLYSKSRGSWKGQQRLTGISCTVPRAPWDVVLSVPHGFGLSSTISRKFIKREGSTSISLGKMTAD